MHDLDKHSRLIGAMNALTNNNEVEIELPKSENYPRIVKAPESRNAQFDTDQGPRVQGHRWERDCVGSATHAGETPPSGPGEKIPTASRRLTWR